MLKIMKSEISKGSVNLVNSRHLKWGGGGKRDRDLIYIPQGNDSIVLGTLTFKFHPGTLFQLCN